MKERGERPTAGTGTSRTNPTARRAYISPGTARKLVGTRPRCFHDQVLNRELPPDLPLPPPSDQAVI